MRSSRLPRNASTWLATPFIAFKKIWGSIKRQGCWCGSMESSRSKMYCMNWGVWLITWGQQSDVGDPIILMKRYHDWATQSLLMPGGINWLSSSAKTKENVSCKHRSDFIWTHEFLAQEKTSRKRIQEGEPLALDWRDSTAPRVRSDDAS